MIKKAFLTILLVSLFHATNAQNFLLKSPDGNTELIVDIGETVSYSVIYSGIKIVQPSTVGFLFKDEPPLGANMKVTDSQTFEENKSWKPVLKRYETIIDQYKGLRLDMKEDNYPGRDFSMEFRVYNDGIAFRSEIYGRSGRWSTTVMDEMSIFNFTEDYQCWSADYKSYISHQEQEFFSKQISGITREMITGLPVTIKAGEDIYAAVTEAALVDYAGMYLKPAPLSGRFALRSQLSPLPGQPESGAKAVFNGRHFTPWRVIMLGKTPGDLVESEIIQNLNEPCEIIDPSWIDPGVSAWDHWWSGEVKMEMDVIKEYIDLASFMGWKYMLIDWQWYGQFNLPESDIMKPAPQIDMQEILSYAREKNVRCWLWLYWTDVDRSDFEKACALYKSWGIAGVKIDFMQRDDQEMVNWYHRVVKTAASHKLMVDFHGAYKPTGWRRTYPNLLTREGVLGNEYNKWSLRITPEHMCTIPFTRMLAGPMDFTPGGFLNRNKEFKNDVPATVQGTRANTLSQFVIYDSPYLVACDHPDNYAGQTGVEFLQKVYSVWDDTKVLNGEIGEYITMARRNGDYWFLGSMTNSHARDLVIELDFLGEKKYKMVSFEDCEETIENAEMAARKEKIVKRGDIIRISMKPGGGYAACLEPL